MADILDQFEQKRKEQLTVKHEYEAFKAVDRRQLRLKIRPASPSIWERVTYAYLLHIMEDGEAGTQVVLVFTFMVVVITGRNLQAVAEAIEQERCDFIQAYDPGKWARPEDPGAAFIESIVIHARAAEDLPGLLGETAGAGEA